MGNSLEIRSFWGFPGGPVLGCLVPTAGATVQSLVRELRSYMLCGSAKKKKKKEKEKNLIIHPFEAFLVAQMVRIHLQCRRTGVDP